MRNFLETNWKSLLFLTFAAASAIVPLTDIGLGYRIGWLLAFGFICFYLGKHREYLKYTRIIKVK